MSKVIETRKFIVVTTLGNVVVHDSLIEGFDIEDVVKAKAISQARLLQAINIANDIDPNATLPSYALPTVFGGTNG